MARKKTRPSPRAVEIAAAAAPAPTNGAATPSKETITIPIEILRAALLAKRKRLNKNTLANYQENVYLQLSPHILLEGYQAFCGLLKEKDIGAVRIWAEMFNMISKNTGVTINNNIINANGQGISGPRGFDVLIRQIDQAKAETIDIPVVKALPTPVSEVEHEE